jgi:hypothetical protein
LTKRVRSRSISLKLPTLRFRGKIMLGFVFVLAISAVSMGMAYMGFERVSSGVVAYRNSGRQVRPPSKPNNGAFAETC